MSGTAGRCSRRVQSRWLLVLLLTDRPARSVLSSWRPSWLSAYRGSVGHSARCICASLRLPVAAVMPASTVTVCCRAHYADPARLAHVSRFCVMSPVHRASNAANAARGPSMRIHLRTPATLGILAAEHHMHAYRRCKRTDCEQRAESERLRRFGHKAIAQPCT
jgi:hypothetical protein